MIVIEKQSNFFLKLSTRVKREKKLKFEGNVKVR